MNKLLQLFPPGHPAGKMQRLKGLYAYRRQRAHWRKDEDWNLRVQIAKECPDNECLVHVEHAGSIKDNWILMHNGLWVEAGGYYGPDANLLLLGNRGTHEPQEEHLFSKVIKALPAGSIILELGSYWGFYSMWFKRDVPRARCYLVEADPANAEVGQRNFERNGLSIDGSLLAKIGSKTTLSSGAPPTTTLDAVLEHFSLQHITLLHADIQGHEYAMFLGAQKTLENQRVDVMFISTHSMGTHYRCKAVLESAGYLVPWSIDCIDSYSFDGLLVAHLPGVLSIKNIPVSLRSTSF
jgi:FkbM family methyltransferase